MKNKIYLAEILKTFWLEKLKIIIITLICLIIAIIYNIQNKEKPLYEVSMVIEPRSDSSLIRFLPINQYLTKNLIVLKKEDGLKDGLIKEIIPVNGNKIFKKYLEIFDNYDDLKLIIKKNNFLFAEKIEKLPSSEQEKEFIKISKKFSVERKDLQEYKNLKLRVVGEEYTITFIWPEAEEAKDIFNDVLTESLSLLKQKMYEEIDFIFNFYEYHTISENNKKIEYLKEQSMVAKELNIENNAVEDFEMRQLNLSRNSTLYYLRGYKAIDKEIEIMEQRVNNELIFIKNEIQNLKKNDDFKLIKYNSSLISVKSLAKSENFRIYVISIILGLLIGLTYVLLVWVIKNPENN
ncbi:hypothetical protein ACIJYF_00895 [Candidatus Pelagibacter bacterium nBUS_49]|uniref:hypothetical protein n=1 Tax=Candidatus Pelagibacter bacterium nBUS_49 TaxID=3374196 RepID=UPI003EB98388